MRRLLAILFVLGLVSTGFAQVASIQEINLYGLRKVRAESILTAGNLHVGGPLPVSRGALEEAIARVPGVLRARVEAICCEGPNALVFVGIEERDGPHVEFHPPSAGDALLPAEIMDAYHQFLAALRRTEENAQPGGKTVRDPALNATEERFATFASADLAILRDTLRQSADPEERAAAAIVIGYDPNKTEIAPDLQYALRDPDDSVRSNAIRSLHAAVAASEDPTEGIPVPLGTLVDLLQSLVLSDRLEAADMLVTLTNSGNREALTLMRARALAALVEMARWDSLEYAIRPYILVGRIAGFSEDDIIKWWSNGQREHVIQKALAGPRPASPPSNTAPRKQSVAQ
jgi:HEAT repeats